MTELLHIIGFCPDNFSHHNILDLFILNYQEFLNYIKTIKFYLWN